MTSNRFAAYDDYGLLHLASHLYARRENSVLRRALYALISEPFMREKQRRTFSHRSFLNDLSLIIEAASKEIPINFSQEVRGSFLTAILSTSTSALSPEYLGIMVDVGQGKRAMEVASFIQNERIRCKSYIAIAEASLKYENKIQAIIALDCAWEITSTIWEEDFMDEYHELETTVYERFPAQDYDTFSDMVGQGLEVPWRRNDALIEIVQGFSRAGAIEKACEVADELKHTSARYTRGDGLVLVAQELAMQGNQSQAWEIIETLDADSVKDEVLVGSVLFLIQEQKIDLALKIFQQIEEIYPRNAAIAELAKALAHDGEVEQALTIIEEIKKGPSDTSEDYTTKQYRSVGWLAIAEAFVQRSEFDRAEHVIKLIHRSVLGVTDLEHLVDLQIRLGNTVSAVYSIECFLQAGWRWEDWEYKIIALKKIGYALALLATTMPVDDVIELIEVLSHAEERLYLQICFAGALGEKKQKRVAIRLLQDSLAWVQEIQADDTGQAFEISISPIIFEHIKKTLLRAVAEAAPRVFEPAQAIEFIKGIVDYDEQSIAVTAFVVALATTGYSSYAIKMIDSILENSIAIPLSENRDDALATIALELKKTSLAEKTVDIIASITSKEIQEDVSRAEKESLENKVQLYEDSVEKEGNLLACQADGIENDQKKARQAFASLPKSVFDYVDDFNAPLQKAEKVWKNKIFQAIQKMANVGDAAGSLEATEVLKTDVNRADALAEIAIALASGSWIKKANEIALRIQDTKIRIQVLVYISLSLYHQGEKERALVKWEMALQDARWIDVEQVLQVLGSGAFMLAQIDDGKILWEVFEAVQEIEGWWPFS
jgi:tetratricopeptide (TPR) repeat protein